MTFNKRYHLVKELFKNSSKLTRNWLSYKMDREPLLTKFFLYNLLLIKGDKTNNSISLKFSNERLK